MGQYAPLRGGSGSRGVDDHGVVAKPYSLATRRDLLARHRLREFLDGRCRDYAGPSFTAQHHYSSKMWCLGNVENRRIRRRKRWKRRSQFGSEIRSWGQSVRGEDHFELGVGDYVAQFAAAKTRIERHQHCAGERRTEHRIHEFLRVGSEDAHRVTRPHP
ncbi:hypothetical protein CH300_04970 [Rhodococcus sp. 15-1154-1]|nr:hypothetical protein CH300_04970 [Rhodococcus sp. 15-1154-1]